MLCLTASAATGTWQSIALGTTISYKTTDAPSPAKDKSGKLMTVVYLENLACEKIGQNSNADDVAWLLSQGYRVIELDYAHDAKSISPTINQDIIAINKELNKGSFCGCQNISPDRAYILFEGYRIQRDVSYYKDDPSVYNYPDTYAKTEGDSLYMDIVYPANPSRPVATILSFSYSNSYGGNAHKRMFLGYTWAMFNDSFMEGAPAVGVAWAIADHPKYCDWGRGNRQGGAQKEYGSIEINPDAARKVRSAVRTLRSFGRTVGMGHDVAIYGFSRGSTAGSLAIGDNPFDEWQTTDRGRYPDESADVQMAFLGPGVFDYNKMEASTNEYKHMTVYANSTSNASAAWSQQGGALAIKSKAVPCFLFYNTDDDKQYDIQMKNLTSILDNTGTKYELVKDYGTGHSVPQDAGTLGRMYSFLKQNITTGIKPTTTRKKAKRGRHSCRIYSVTGAYVGDNLSGISSGIYLAQGKKVIK